MKKTHLIAAPLLVAVVALAREASAEPRQTIWLEDVHLQPAATTEAAFFYEFQGADFKALEEGSDLVALRLPAGIADWIEITPQLRLRQRGDEPFRLHDLGGEVRARLLGDAARPRLVGYAGYFNQQSSGHDHRFAAGTTGRYDVGRWFAAADVRLSAVVGGDKENGGELWIGAAGGCAFLERHLAGGLEVFAIRPIGGERISDPVFGQAARDQSLYVGPSLSARIGPLWTGLSVASGFMVSEPASHLLVRWMVGVSR